MTYPVKISQQNFQNTMFMWNDTKDTRKNDSKLIVFLNDENDIDSGIIDGFKNYDVDTIPWSKKEKYIHLLNAS